MKKLMNNDYDFTDEEWKYLLWLDSQIKKAENNDTSSILYTQYKSLEDLRQQNPYSFNSLYLTTTDQLIENIITLSYDKGLQQMITELNITIPMCDTFLKDLLLQIPIQFIMAMANLSSKNK